MSKAAQKDDEFAGMTILECPTACNIDRCVISGRPYCAHPGKSGLQLVSADAAAIERFAKAKTRLEHQKVDTRMV